MVDFKLVVDYGSQIRALNKKGVIVKYDEEHVFLETIDVLYVLRPAIMYDEPVYFGEGLRKVGETKMYSYGKYKACVVMADVDYEIEGCINLIGLRQRNNKAELMRNKSIMMKQVRKAK